MFRGFACAGMLGGLLRVIASFMPATGPSDHLELFYVVIDLCLILGLVGIYLAHHLSLSQWGHCGFIISLCAFSFIAGPDTVFFGASAYQLGTPLVGIGLLLLAIGLRSLQSIPSYGADSLLLSVILGIVATVLGSSVLFIMSGVLLGIGFIISSYFVWCRLDYQKRQ